MYNNYPNMYNNFDDNQNLSNYDYPRNLDVERLIFEFQENRRRINNLLKRITRLENYLRIKDEDVY